MTFGDTSGLQGKSPEWIKEMIVSTPDFYVLDDKGQKFTPTYLAPDGTHLLDMTSLQAGQSIAGVVAFDLPMRHGRLVLPHSDGEPQLVWKF